MELKNAVVIITGGGTGIGRATALRFAAKGASVIVCGRRYEPLAETVKLIKQGGGEALAISTDVRIWTEITAMVDSVLERFGKIDCLVNNAGVVMIKPVAETTEKEWGTIMDINLKGVFLCSKAVLPKMLKKGSGLIINVSSTFGRKGVSNLSAYCASKFGVMGFTQALAEEVKTKEIQAFAVCPGATDTEMNRVLLGQAVSRQYMPPEKVANKIVDLAAGKIHIESGGFLVVDEQFPCPALPEAQDKWRQVAKRWLRGILKRC